MARIFSTWSPLFRTGGNCMMEIRGVKSRTCISVNSMTPRTSSVGTPLSRLKYALTQDVLQSQCCGSEKWRWRNHWTILLTSLSIEGRDFPEFEMLDAKIASTLERIISNQYFRRRVNVEEQECSNIRQISTRKAACLYDFRPYSSNRRSWRTGPIRSSWCFLTRWWYTVSSFGLNER